jgi:dUTP pyrophosphatase
MRLPVRLTLPEAKLPTKAHPEDAAYDLYSPLDFTLSKGQTITVNLGVHFSIPKGWYGQIAGRSSLAKAGCTVLGGVVDSGYTGPVHAILVNLGHEDRAFKQGDRIAQIIILPVAQADIELVAEFERTTNRGDGGFGSSGR